MRVAAFVPYPVDRVPGQRFRIEQWAPLLRDEGIEVTFAPFLPAELMDVLYKRGHLASKVVATIKGYGGRLRDILRGTDADAVYLFREAALLGPALLERLLARRWPVVFDFDDAIYLPATSKANAMIRALKAHGKTAAICRLAAHVTVGNEDLAAYAAQHNRNVTVVPTSIDTQTYRPAPRQPTDRPIVGWTGSITTLAHLERLKGMLARLRSRVPFDLHVMGGHIEVQGVDVCWREWDRRAEVPWIQQYDVGIMPLPEDEWARGKCGLKALQYMALGIPAVVSPVGVNGRIVTDGEDGFHARTEEEWIDRLERLLRDASLRARMGERARATVETTYSAWVVAPQMGRVLRSVRGAS